MTAQEIDFSYEKKLIHDKMNEEASRKKELVKQVIEATTYKKGEITKEVFNLPMPSSKDFLNNKNVNVKTYGAIMLKSNWGGKFLNQTDRYLYKNKFDEIIGHKHLPRHRIHFNNAPCWIEIISRFKISRIRYIVIR